MSTILSVYSKIAFKEYLLPAVENDDYLLVIDSGLFGLELDLELKMEVIDGKWSFIPKDGMILYYASDKRQYNGEELTNGDVISFRISSDNNISVVVKELDNVFSVYEKFDIRNITSLTIGKNSNNVFTYGYEDLVSRDHAVIFKSSDGIQIEDKSANGTFINGKRIRGRTVLSFGDCIDVFGLRFVYLGTVLAVNTNVEGLQIRREYLSEFAEVSGGGKFSGTTSEKKLFHRSPRNLPKIETEKIEIDAPPNPKELSLQPPLMAIGPSLTMALPMLMGCLLSMYGARANGMGSSVFMYTGLVTAIGSALLGAFWSINNMRYAKKKNKEEEEFRRKAYDDYLLNLADEVKTKYEHNTLSLLELYPECASLCTYDRDSLLLWNRNYRHDDFLAERLGLGSLPFQVPIEVPRERFTLIKDSLAPKPSMIRDTYKYLHNVPVCLDFMENKLVGIIGGKNREGCYQVMHNLVAGIAANNCYTDIKTVFLYDSSVSEREDAWSFAKWLPHSWSEDKKSRFVATNKSEAGDVLYEITQVLRMRAEEKTNSFDEIGYRPYYILFVETEKLLEGELISKYVFDQKENYGLSTVIMAEGYDELPNACEYIIENTNNFKGLYNVVDGYDDRIEIAFDSVSTKTLEDFARRLSNIEVREEEQTGEIPENLGFLEMYHVNHPSDLRVLERWKKARTYETMKALVGQRSGGVDCYLDIHEKYHGPHGLVAGTTGSGKSETLQTYMLSLALNYSPDDIGFFVIDYKGGGMANLFDGLPHMIGAISNLSGNQVRRAMVSIKSENLRRQRIFNEHGVNNINLYTRLYKSKEATIPVPHMFIVIDEFAELKREEPEFMKELISVAQVGRSLGVHLILATQKPSGTVDDNIWSNSKFRLCLRVQDRQDSNDMLHKPDAAYLTQAGRCYLQVGNDELYELFQSAYSGAEYDKDNAGATVEVAMMIEQNGKASVVGSSLKTKAKKDGQKAVTELEAVIEHLGIVAKKGGYTHDLKLWLPVLKTEIFLDELKGYSEYAYSSGWKKQSFSKGVLSLNTIIGMYDDPEHQAQEPLCLDLIEGGNHAIIGTVSTGKSTFISTFIYSLISTYDPASVNIYGIDFSSKMLAPFEKAPHVGGIMFEEDSEKISKFFNMITTIHAERKKLFRGGSYAQYVRANGLKYPVILIAVDNMGAFREKTGNKYDDILLNLLKEGISTGIYFLVSAGGFSMSEISGKMADNFRTTLTLELNDKYAYSEILRTMHIDVMPEENVRGRGLCKVGDAILEYHTALPFAAEDDYVRAESMENEFLRMSDAWNGKTARKIPEIPSKPVWSTFADLPEVSGIQNEGDMIPFGYDYANAMPYGIRLDKTYAYNVSGTLRTGSINALKCIIASISGMSGELCIIDQTGALVSVASNVKKATYITDAEGMKAYFEQLVPKFKDRNAIKKSLDAQGLADEEVYDRMQQFEKIFIVIDDLPMFIKTMDRPGDDIPSMSPFLCNLLDKGALHNVFWIYGFNQEDRNEVMSYQAYRLFIRDGMGAHFGGKMDSQQALPFEHMSFTDRSKTVKPNVAMISTHDFDDTTCVIVPMYDGNQK